MARRYCFIPSLSFAKKRQIFRTFRHLSESGSGPSADVEQHRLRRRNILNRDTGEIRHRNLIVRDTTGYALRDYFAQFHHLVGPSPTLHDGVMYLPPLETLRAGI